MAEALLHAVRRWADAEADGAGVAPTPIPGLTAIRQTRRTELDYAISRPLVCLVVQGTKHVATGAQSFSFGAGDTLLITADVPTVSQITRASAGEPYYSLVMDIDPALTAELAAEMSLAADERGAPVRVEPTDAELAEAAARLMKLMERPESLVVLGRQLVREFHYWPLVGRHGPAIRRLALPDGQAQRIGRAVALLRSDYARRLPVERLAAAAGMSPSSFHQHFRALTSLTPLQFQKQMRLIEARRLMLAEGASASHAAYAVGYESVHQFTREYGRMFGLPPAREVEAARARLQAAA
jgi:AraC-like DNA-binding protein